ncbi:hypothetical protein B5E77_07025 [Lachnoclostridium sp. An131]|uniref:sensor histidine kinase n=1 Tax=Lachnoclostridium sp. An131 TaxID=1965555 RepID=UPI000B385CA4|nr:ATP-binding protein [Lachnoclostridium sp. An131]OUQ27295.1 hypothetical protein B5E77_07025 [Lachnoclostridium sp. An131]
MKDLLKICRRYIVTAVLTVCLVLAVNIIFFFVYVVRENMHKADPYYYNWRTERLAEALTLGEDGYTLSEDAARKIDDSYAFAMMIDQQGNVVWSRNLPEDIPLSYSLTDIASMTRWYLKDYPVKVWTRPDGLFVVAKPKDSIAKYDVEINLSTLKALPSYLGAYLLCNLLMVFFLSLFFGVRLYKALKSVAGGIENLHLQKPLNLPERGMTATLARKLNDVSILLYRQKLALDKRDNARTEWISGVSHDIRTPLSLIMGHADSLEQNSSLDETGKKEAASIRENSLQIRNLIADLNLTSKLEYDSYPLRLAPCSPAALIRSLAAWHINNGLPDQFQLELHLSPEMEGAAVSGDADLLQRAFRNLTGNSIRHNPKGCRIQIDAFLKNDMAELCFSDTGRGIPLTVIKALYRPVSSSHKGSGQMETSSHPAPHVMGLRIVKQIVEAHHGQLEFELQGDACRRIKISLPLCSQTP